MIHHKHSETRSNLELQLFLLIRLLWPLLRDNLIQSSQAKQPSALLETPVNVFGIKINGLKILTDSHKDTQMLAEKSIQTCVSAPNNNISAAFKKITNNQTISSSTDLL